ncbi:MAG: energy-coupling factor transport system substrate-specific component [Thermoleophilaceae bacterium]|nr:energy-coupling factor transport system substrate-specific component [Thermoleophilaceae bacterium]
MSWLASSLIVLALALAAGFAWYERRRPSARVLSLVAALAALAVVGRIAFAAFPNVKPTTDIVLFSGYALGGAPGFAVGAVAALVSNFFFGQGPWTPWQMAAWGAVGLLGAGLARLTRGRQLGRAGLAIACGLAGLFFGVVMDGFQWTVSEPHTVAAYGAISARSLGFNIAHVVGNVVFCLVIGPAFIRALQRYRRRFEVRWALPVAAALLGVVLMAAPALAASPTARALGYLGGAQNTDGGFGGARGQGSTQLHSGWVALGYAATGRNPRTVQRGGASVIDYMRGQAGSLNDTGELERTILVLRASGLSARSFAGRDLIGELTRRRKSGGSFGTTNLTAFGVLALRASGVSASKSARWLETHANHDGGYGFAPGAGSDADDTGAVLQALAAGGRRGGSASRRAVAYLRRVQHSDGGFGQLSSNPSNAQSTAWVVQGLVAAGKSPASVKRGGRSPLDYLRSLQRGDGSFRYSRTGAQTPVWVTAQVLTALAQKPFPIAAVALPARRGSGGGSSASGGGGTAGGGSPGGRSKDGGAGAKKPGHGSSRPARSGAGGHAPAGAPAPAAAVGTRASESVAARTGSDDGGTALAIVAVSCAALVLLAVLWWRRRGTMDDVLPR